MYLAYGALHAHALARACTSLVHLFRTSPSHTSHGLVGVIQLIAAEARIDTTARLFMYVMINLSHMLRVSSSDFTHPPHPPTHAILLIQHRALAHLAAGGEEPPEREHALPRQDGRAHEPAESDEGDGRVDEVAAYVPVDVKTPHAPPLPPAIERLIAESNRQTK